MTIKELLNNKRFLMTVSVFSIAMYSIVVSAAAPVGGYAPGEQLDPSCAPGATDCIVKQAWQQDVGNGFVYNTADKIGIGVSVPESTLEVAGDFSVTTLPVVDEMLFQKQGDISSLGGENGFVWYAGDQVFNKFGFMTLDYGSGVPVYGLALSDGVNNGNFSFAPDGMSMITGGVMQIESKTIVPDLSSIITLNPDGTLAINSNMGTYANSIYTNSNGLMTLNANETTLNNARSNLAISSSDIYYNNQPSVKMYATGDNGVTYGNMAVSSEGIGMYLNTDSTQNAGSGTPLVIQVGDENTRGGGFSARSRNLTYANAGADMFVWDQALGGDRTWIWMDETKIDSGLRLEPTLPGVANYTTNNINEISFQFHSGDINNYSVFRINDDFTWGKSASTVMFLEGDTGRLGIGVTSLTDKLEVLGDIRVGDSGVNGCLKDYSGGTITGTCSSDERLKTNINPVTGILDRFSNINLVTYTWNDIAQSRGFKGDVGQLGVLAQNVEQSFPELVTTDSSGYKQVNYGRLNLLAIEAIKELKLRVDALSLAAGQSAAGTVVSTIKELFTDKIHTTTLCVGTTNNETCLSKEQVDALMNLIPSAPAPVVTPPTPEPEPTPATDPTTNTGDTSSNADSSITEPTQDAVVTNPPQPEEPVTESPVTAPAEGEPVTQ